MTLIQDSLIDSCIKVAQLPSRIVDLIKDDKNIIAYCCDGEFYLIDVNYKVSKIS